MLNPHRALEFASAAGGALKRRLLGDVLAEQRRFIGRAEFIEVIAHPENDLLRVEHLPGIGRGAVFGAAPALHATEGLQGVDAREILARVEAEIFVASEWRNAAEALPLEKHRRGTKHQVQMFGVW